MNVRNSIVSVSICTVFVLYRYHLRMTKCVKVLRAKAKAKSMDQSQARIRRLIGAAEPVSGPCFLLLLLLVTL